MNQILAALLNAQPAATAPSSTTPSTQTPASTDPTSTAQFKSQFDQAVAMLTNAVTPSSQGTTTPSNTGAAQATTAGSTVQSVATADSLQATLQKKIADLLAQGDSVSEIVQQLAASLAATLAQHFGGDPTQIQNQLQTAFASALAPPTTTGPPLSNTDLASALAQRFRQVADVAAGVIGEQGQSNRLFAGSTSDAATTAGVQPAPTTTTTPADSTADDAQALLAALTASDGKTVATTNGAQLTGSNGDTLLGRILTRAANSQTTSTPVQELTPADLTGASSPSLANMALAAAAAALGSSPASATPTPLATDSLAAAISRIAASADVPAAQAVTLATQAPAPLSPTVTAFLKTFTDALTLSTSGNAKTTVTTADPGTLLQTDITSAQAPTIGAFASVQAAIAPDATGAGATQSAQTQTPLPTTTADPSDVINQVLRGAFMTTTGDVSTVRLRLVPETLGDISVKLTIDGSNVSAQVMAQTPAAHDALVAGQQQLTRSLADAGLKLTSFNVDLAGGFASFQQQQQQQSSQQGQSQGRSLLLGGVDTTESDESTLNATPNFGPPVLANSNWSALNYLV
jgi:flagellar hook-length control protein FliK